MRALYATDGSAPAREAEKLLERLFHVDHLHIDVITVRPEMPALPGLNTGTTGWALPPFDEEQVAREAADRLALLGFSTMSRAARGAPANEILRVLTASNHDLAILGASQSSWLGHLLLGSVNNHVLHHAPCPVLIAHKAPSGSGQVLVAIDGSAESLAAMNLATRLLDPRRCTMTVATSVVIPMMVMPIYAPGPIVPYPSQSSDVAFKQAWELVEQAAEEIRREGFTATAAVLEGSPVPQLLKEAENLAADLVVLGSRGLGAVRRSVLGSVSDQVVRHVPAALVGRSTSRKI